MEVRMVIDSLNVVGLNKQKLLQLMKEKSLDACLVTSPENVFYTTGCPTLPSSGNPIVYAMKNQLPFFAYIGKEGEVILICWGGITMGVDFAVDDVRPFFTYEMSKDVLTELIQEKIAPGSKVGVESNFPFYVAQMVQEHSAGTNLEIVDDLFARLRLVKSSAEIERIRKSTQIIDKTVMELVPLLHLGMGRLELIHEAKYLLMKNGAEGVDHITAAFGPANPEVAFDEPLEKDQIVTLDLGAAYEGYVSDNRRLVYTGKIPEALRELHKKVCWIVAEIGKELKPGKTFAELHAYAYELYAKMELEPMFMHIGHSMGIQVDERWILGDDQTVLEPGMVLNIELYSPTDDMVMIGDEETYVVTKGEPEKVGKLPVDIIERIL
jgi:Xaa-Pro aminopeptidase